MQTERIIRCKLSDEVQNGLLRLMSSGDLPPDDAMPSGRELMKRIGVGHPAIREVMQALPTRGLYRSATASAHGPRN